MFIFLHVHKSAGTTLRHVIESQHRARWSAIECYAWGWDPQEAACQILRIAGAHRDALEVVYGHVHYGIHRYLPRPSAYYTLLRDPVERAISYYSYWLKKVVLTDETHPDRPRALRDEITLEEFVSSGCCPEMDNGQTRLFAGEQGLYDRVPLGQCTDALLDQAKFNLREKIAVVGLTEQFDASLLLIQRLCGWGTPYYVRKNVTGARPRREEISTGALQAIHRATELDRELYAYGVQLFQESVARQGPSFAEDVRQFQARNRRYGSLRTGWFRFLRRQRRTARSAWERFQSRTGRRGERVL